MYKENLHKATKGGIRTYFHIMPYVEIASTRNMIILFLKYGFTEIRP